MKVGDGSGDALSKVCTELVHTADTTKVDGDVKEKLLCFALDLVTRDEAFTRVPLDFDTEFVLRIVTRDEAFTRAPLLTTKSFWL